LQQELSKCVVKEIGKPEKWVMVVLRDNVSISFAGTDAPAALCTLASIGGIGATENAKLSKSISSILSGAVKISPDRTYIKFDDVEAHNWGWNGGTF